MTVKTLMCCQRSIHLILQGQWRPLRSILAYITRETILVQTYGAYPKYATPDDEIIARMLHLPPDKKKLHSKQDAQTVRAHTAEWEIDNRNVYDIIDQICKDTDLRWLYRCLCMMERRRHETGKSMLPAMSSTILSWEMHQV